jgi:hypothetical protein
VFSRELLRALDRSQKLVAIDLQVENAIAGWHAFGGRHLNLDIVWNSTAAAESMAHNQWLYSPEDQ